MDPFTILKMGELLSKVILPDEVCMSELGCFEFLSPLFIMGIAKILPFPRHTIDTKFHLYTPEDPNTPQTFSNLHTDMKSILTTSFNPKRSTNFIVGGFLSGKTTEWKKRMVDGLIKHRYNNVFLVEWDGGDDVYDYAFANTRVVGAEMALFIQRLQNISGLNPGMVHIIGHSLGAHIAGFAGKRVKGLGFITGLDPAGPGFTGVDPKQRLDRKDAFFVDVIHTDMSSTVLTGFGLEESIGDFDFFPNGGKDQPGCTNLGYFVYSVLLDPVNHKSYPGIECSHSRAEELYIASLENTKCKLWGAVCDSWEDYESGKCGSCKDGKGGKCIPLGIDDDQYIMEMDSKPLKIYLTTTDKEPFC